MFLGKKWEKLCAWNIWFTNSFFMWIGNQIHLSWPLLKTERFLKGSSEFYEVEAMNFIFLAGFPLQAPVSVLVITDGSGIECLVITTLPTSYRRLIYTIILVLFWQVPFFNVNLKLSSLLTAKSINLYILFLFAKNFMKIQLFNYIIVIRAKVYII